MAITKSSICLEIPTLAGGGLFFSVVRYRSRQWALHRWYNPDNPFVTGLWY
jgi:hypothetical protein